jgi:hypothetical protein
MDYEHYEDIWASLTHRLNAQAIRHHVETPRHPCAYCDCIYRLRTALENYFYGPRKR